MKTISRSTGICAVAILTILAANGQSQTKEAAPAKETAPAKEVAPAKLDAATEKYLGELKAATKSLIETLTGIQDKASADAAVPALKKLRELFDRNLTVLDEQIRVNPAVFQRIQQLAVDGKGISEQIARIKAKGYYGSKALSEVLAGDSEEQPGDQPAAKEAAPAKEVAPAEEGAALIMSYTPPPIQHGKDGAAVKEAAPATDKSAATKAWKVIVAGFDEWATTLAGVTDKASAEAAVPKIQKIRETVNSQGDALSNAQFEVSEAPVRSLQKINAEMQRSNEKQFFGCKELETVLTDPARIRE